MADGVDIYWQAWLPDTAAKAVVVLSHGYSEHCNRYAHVGAALTDAGYALCALDHRGHGRSGGGRGQVPAYETFLDDYGQVIAMARAAHPGVKCFIYGHSMGGNIALVYAITRPENLSGVIATGPLLGFAIKPPGWKVVLANVLNEVAPNFSMSAGLETEALCRDESVVQDYVDDPLVHDRLSTRLGKEWLRQSDFALEHAGELLIPALLMHGSADRLTSPAATRQFAERASNADVTFIEYAGMYHELHNEPEQAKVFTDMIGWLNERAG